ncbi:MAG: TonB-dependent receptor [Halieaceae bacterium]
MKQHLIMAASVWATAWLAATTTQAQSSIDESLVLEEVIVTANRREQRLQDVAISVSAFTDQFFKDSGTKSLKQLEQYTPSLKITPVTDSRSTSIRIRGIGSVGTNAGIDPSVGVFIDGVYQGRAGMSIADLMDIERVEVLRGPQGSLYGKNTAAGALNIISKTPSQQFELELEGVYGNHQATEFRGTVNLPLGDSGHATRLSGYKVERDGFDDNIVTGDEINDADRWGVRSRTRFDLDDWGDLMLSLDYGKEDSNCCAADIMDWGGEVSSLGLPFEDFAEAYNSPLPPADGKDRKLLANRPYANQVEVGGVSMEWNVDVGEHGLTWLNAWRAYDNDSTLDGDFSQFESVAGYAKVDMDQYSSELRFTSAEHDNWDYQAGLYFYYSDMDTDGQTGMLPQAGQLFANGLIFPGGSVNFDSNTHKTTSYAAFGQANWNINEQWRLTVGGRVTSEEKERDGSQMSRPAPAFPLDAPPIAGPDFSVSETRSQTNFSPSLSLTYFMREDLMFYASAAQGFKSGGFNQLRTAIGVPGEFDDERSRNYELGWKGSWLDRRLQVNGTVFYVDYDDFQAQGFDGTNITVRNAGSLESKGLELDVIFLVGSNLTTGLAVGYNDAEYQDFKTGECTVQQLFDITGGSPFIPPDCVQDLSGEKLDNAPEWTVSTYAQYENQLPGTQLSWTGRVEYNYTDDFYMAQDLDENLRNDSVNLVNARLSLLTSDGSWELTAWGRNLLDEEYYVVAFDVPTMSGFAGILAPPLTYGVTLNYRIE